MLDEFKGSAALDAALVAAAQAVEHYEIARYGTLKRWAETLGMADAAKLLDATLQEEARDRRGAVRPRPVGRQRAGARGLTAPAGGVAACPPIDPASPLCALQRAIEYDPARRRRQGGRHGVGKGRAFWCSAAASPACSRRRSCSAALGGLRRRSS